MFNFFRRSENSREESSVRLPEQEKAIERLKESHPELITWKEFRAMRLTAFPGEPEVVTTGIRFGEIQRAIDEKRPIGLSAVPEDAMPSGYVREGDLYVYRSKANASD